MAEDGPREGSTRPRPAGASRQGSGADTGWAIVGTMLSGMAVWGGAGWLLDRWLDTRVFAPVGILLGMAAAIYVVVVRYGGADPHIGRRPGRTGTTGTTTGTTGTTTGGRRSRPGTQKGRR
jgi:F0F1-type ATP synthase assembly protein I